MTSSTSTSDNPKGGKLATSDTMRFEGETNPADQDIVFAIQCICGCKGTYTPRTDRPPHPDDAGVLRQLAHAPHHHEYPPRADS